MVIFIFYFLVSCNIINQTETDKDRESSLQTKAREARRLPETKLKETKETNAYFATSRAAAFPLLQTQRKEHERKDLANRQISNTSVEIGHKGQPERSRIASMLSLESLSTQIYLHYSPLASCKAQRMTSASTLRGEDFGMIFVQILITAPASFLAMTAKAAFE